MAKGAGKKLLDEVAKEQERFEAAAKAQEARAAQQGQGGRS